MFGKFGQYGKAPIQWIIHPGNETQNRHYPKSKTEAIQQRLKPFKLVFKNTVKV